MHHCCTYVAISWVESLSLSPLPLLQLLVLIAEADLYKVWVPFMEDSREIVGAGYRKIVYVKVGLPWPFEPRDSVRLCCL